MIGCLLLSFYILTCGHIYQCLTNFCILIWIHVIWYFVWGGIFPHTGLATVQIGHIDFTALTNRKLLSLKISSVWAVLHTSLHYWQYMYLYIYIYIYIYTCQHLKWIKTFHQSFPKTKKHSCMRTTLIRFFLSTCMCVFIYTIIFLYKIYTHILCKHNFFMKNPCTQYLECGEHDAMLSMLYTWIH